MNERQEGFSLIEILAVLGLFVLMLGLGVLQTRGGATGGSAGARGMAQVLAGELKAARQKAIETHSPVAVVLPSAAGTRPHSQSLYILEGVPHPKVTRVTNLAGEFQNAYLAVGVWAGPGNTIDSPRISRPASFYLPGWPDPATKDYMLTFDPEGNLLTNDLPWFDGRCHVVACSGLDFASSGPPPGTPRAASCIPAYFQFSKLYQPYTVSLDPSGTVFLEPGLPGANGSVAVAAGFAAPDMPPAAPASLAFAGNTPPEIREITVLPVGNPTLAVNTTIPMSGYATLIVRAADADGDRLSCQWTCNRGSMSHLPGGGQLSWDPQENVWKSVWIWSPPQDVLDGETTTCSLNCTITDDRGASVSAEGASGLTMDVRNCGKVAFSGPDLAAGSSLGEIYVCNPDGTGARRLTNNTVEDTDPCLSPDGTKIVFCSALGGGQLHLFAMNVDGTGLKELLPDDGTAKREPVFSPDGTQIAFTNNTNEIRVMKFDGSTPTTIATGTSPSWCPAVGNGSIAYERSGNIYVHLPDGSEVPLTDDLPPGARKDPSWTLDGKYVLYTDATGTLTAVNATDPTQKFNKGSSQGSISPLRFSLSPGTSDQVVFATTGGIMRAYDTGVGVPLFDVKPITPYGCAGVQSPTWGP